MRILALSSNKEISTDKVILLTHLQKLYNKYKNKPNSRTFINFLTDEICLITDSNTYEPTVSNIMEKWWSLEKICGTSLATDMRMEFIKLIQMYNFARITSMNLSCADFYDAIHNCCEYWGVKFDTSSEDIMERWLNI